MTPREIDALVAEKVMGGTVENVSEFPYGADMFVTLADKYQRMRTRLPHYSTDIAAAWEVAQRVLELDDDNEFEIHLSQSKHKECTVMIRFWDNSDPNDPVFAGPHYITKETASLAICLAALKSLGVTVET